MPALLTKMVMEPNSFSTVLMARSTSLDSETSAWTAMDLRPRDWICLLTDSAAADWDWKFMATSAPARAKAMAMALPMPRLAPVTRPTRPESVLIGRIPSLNRRWLGCNRAG